MADIAHTVPTSVVYLDGSEFGFVRPGIQVTPFISGRHLSRDWHGYNIVEYDLTPALFNSSDDTLEEWEAFWHHVDGGASAGYIVDPISDTHRDLLCGGLGDASQTTFPIPVLAPTSVTPFVDGVPTTAYTLHSAANLLADDDLASCADNADWSIGNGSSALVTGVSLDGLSCIKVTPDGGGASRLYHLGTKISGLSVGDDYTGVAAVLPTASTSDNYRVQILWYTSGDAYISADSSAYTATAPGSWTVYSVTATAPATTAKGVVALQRQDTGTEPFFGDCFALNPGDYTRWHLPSQTVGVAEFDSALSSGARPTATATGQRVTRCRFEPGTRWSIGSPGHASVRSIRAVEWVEF